MKNSKKFIKTQNCHGRTNRRQFCLVKSFLKHFILAEISLVKVDVRYIFVGNMYALRRNSFLCFISCNDAFRRIFYYYSLFEVSGIYIWQEQSLRSVSWNRLFLNLRNIMRDDFWLQQNPGNVTDSYSADQLKYELLHRNFSGIFSIFK